VQRLLPNYVSATDIKGISSPYIDEWTEGYPPDQSFSRGASPVLRPWHWGRLSHKLVQTTRPKMSDENLNDEIERLRKENEALKKGASGIRMKVSEKGAVSVYGMGRFPVTLYKEQWLRLLDMSAEIRAFIAANEAQLKRKDEAPRGEDR
jgi:hypothetical protein